MINRNLRVSTKIKIMVFIMFYVALNWICKRKCLKPWLQRKKFKNAYTTFLDALKFLKKNVYYLRRNTLWLSVCIQPKGWWKRIIIYIADSGLRNAHFELISSMTYNVVDFLHFLCYDLI